MFFKKNTHHAYLLCPFLPFETKWPIFFALKKRFAHVDMPFLKKIQSWCLILFYSLSDSSKSAEENLKLSVIYLIVFFFCFSMYLHSVKKRPANVFRTFFRNFSSMKICYLSTVRPYFCFQKNFIGDGFAVKLFLSIITDFVPNIIIFFQKLIIFNTKVHQFSFTIVTFYLFCVMA